MCLQHALKPIAAAQNYSCRASLRTATGVDQEHRARMHDHDGDVLNRDVLCATANLHLCLVH